MFGWFEIKSPLTGEQRGWIDQRFGWLRNEFGEDRLRGVVVTPTDEYFPDRYTPSAECAQVILDRLCGYMGVDRERLDLQLYTSPSADDVATAFNPLLQRGFALGAYQAEEGRIVIWLEQTRLDEPHAVVSTLAHELGHVHLLADGRCDPNTPDHEPLTDLLTVYFGLGIFAANNALREINWRSGNWSGWSVSRRGYLSISEYAYALAIFAHTRGERRPRWAKHLRPDVRALFKLESKHLASGTIPPFGGIVPEATPTLGEPATPEPPSAPDELGTSYQEPESVANELQEGEEEPDSDEPKSPFERSADWYFTKGTLFAAEGKHRSALKRYARALELNPCDPEVWLHRAKSHLILHEYSKAIDACTRSLEFDSDELAARCHRAEAYLWRRRYAEALIDLNAASPITKRDPLVHYLLGLTHLGLGNYKRAIAELKQARRYAPTWADIYLARSRAYRALGKTKYAEADLAEAIRRNPALADPATREASLAGRPEVGHRTP